jgi:Zn-dependent peptidase ImmA (M78 family)
MLKRGFKTWCEKIALDFRKELGIGKQMPLKAVSLAEHLNVKIFTPDMIPNFDETNRSILLEEEADAWSAVTLCKNNNYIIITNPRKPCSRQSNDIMHELSHIIIGHKAQMIHSFETGIFLRHFDKDQEAEADWLAATLLLSRDALFRIAFSIKNISTAAKEYGVSEILLNMRLNLTGVKAIQKRKLTAI